MSGHAFRVFPPSSMPSLEGVQTEFGLLLPFLGASRPLRHDSGEKSRGPTFFHHAPGRCFSYIARISKRAKSVKKRYKIQKSNFARLGCVCDFVDRAGALETFLLRVLDVLRDELPCCGAHCCVFAENPYTADLWAGAISSNPVSSELRTSSTVAPSPARLVLVNLSRYCLDITLRLRSGSQRITHHPME